MKVDWKFVSQTEGYQSLKDSVNQDKMRWTGREADRTEGFFRDIIKQCHRVSEHTGIPIDTILSSVYRVGSSQISLLIKRRSESAHYSERLTLS